MRGARPRKTGAPRPVSLGLVGVVIGACSIGSSESARKRIGCMTPLPPRIVYRFVTFARAVDLQENTEFVVKQRASMRDEVYGRFPACSCSCELATAAAGVFCSGNMPESMVMPPPVIT